MDKEALATLQAPLKAAYRENAASAMITLRTTGPLVRGGTVRAEGAVDFRGTLAISKAVPVGFREIRLSFDLDTDATDQQLATLVRLTERYCVVWQSLRQPPEGSVSIARSG